MIRLLITGASGFIGSHTCSLLLEMGYEIIAMDSYINSSPKTYKKIIEIVNSKSNNITNKLKIVEGDLRNIETIKKIFKDAYLEKKPIEGVIHFAGLKAVGESVEHPLKYWDYNFISAFNLVSTMIDFKCKYIVFSSSATIYGVENKGLLKENSKIKPSNPYGNTKAAIEILLQDVFQSNKNKLQIANLRYFNPVGAHPSGLIGEDPKGIPNNIFPIITRVSVGKISKLNVFGNDWPTRDGTGIRDYIHIMDLAEGHIKTLEFLMKNQTETINLNLGTGIGTSVLELIETFELVNKVNIPYEFVPRRKGDISEVIADNTYAKKLLNWAPKKNINDICKDGFNWQLKNPNGFN